MTLGILCAVVALLIVLAIGFLHFTAAALLVAVGLLAVARLVP